jgi:DNA-binding GntR family transcriptional regulator
VRRADKNDIERLTDINDLLIAAFDRGDGPVVARGFQRWLDALVDAGHSLTVRWFSNPMLDSYRDMLERYPSLWVLEPSFPRHLRDVISAISEGNESAAIEATRAYYLKVDGALRTTLQSVPRSSPPPAERPAETATDPAGTVVPMRRRKTPT